MLQLQILSGKQAGVTFDARRFPVRVGRDSANELRLDDEGVWQSHFNISLDPTEGFAVTVHSGALLNINSESIQLARLRNGDIITAGSVRLAFRVSATTQPGLALSEAFVWSLIVAVTVIELTLIYLLLP